ncbi:MAG: EscU/YscU/HrcU family type III secretion system export apparatus switch protein [Bryobacterales bacterium]
MAGQHGEKSEKATPRRQQKARERGQFFSSKDFTGGIQFLVFVMLLGTFARTWMAEANTTTALVLRQAFKRGLNANESLQIGAEAMTRLLMPLGMAALIMLTVTLAAQFVTTKGGLSMAKLKPSLDRLNPIARLKELPGRNIPSTIQAVLMLAVFGGAIYVVVESNLDSFLGLPLAPLPLSMALIGDSLHDLFWKAASVFVLFGMIDLARQHRKYQKDMRMSKHEVREEYKETEGDPYIRARIRRLRRDMLRHQMMKQVPTATAVIVNPTHYAVALRYDHGSTAVPVVVAKGRNHLALRIRQMAVSHGVPLVENPPLAQALYKSVKTGQEIPPHLYRAVAEVLAYIYRLMNKEPQQRKPLARIP